MVHCGMAGLHACVLLRTGGKGISRRGYHMSAIPLTCNYIVDFVSLTDAEMWWSCCTQDCGLVATHLLIGHTFPFYSCTVDGQPAAFRQPWVRSLCSGCLHREHQRLGKHCSSGSCGAAYVRRAVSSDEDVLSAPGAAGEGASTGSESDDSGDDSSGSASSCSSCTARGHTHYSERESAALTDA